MKHSDVSYTLSLCFEKILFNHIHPKIRKHLSNSQHGFREQRSTVTQLLSYLDKVWRTIDFNVPSAAVYFDSGEAFDSVRHDIILNKLPRYRFDHDFWLLLCVSLSTKPFTVCSHKRAHFQSLSCYRWHSSRQTLVDAFFSSFYQRSPRVS